MSKARIVSDPKVMLGTPAVAGTRIAVEYLLEELSHGQSFEGLLSSHPTLTREGSDRAPESPETEVRFLEWRPDLQGFLWSEHATMIDREAYRLNAAERRFERETEGQYQHIGYFTPVSAK